MKRQLELSEKQFQGWIALCHALKLADSGVSAVADERFSASFSFSSVDDERFSAFSHFHSWMMNVFSHFLAFIRG